MQWNSKKRSKARAITLVEMSTETPNEVVNKDEGVKEEAPASSSTVSENNKASSSSEETPEQIKEKFERAKELYNEDKFQESSELFAQVLESQ